jgi:NADPH:quinone reductase-like Zn-dependent oxidoreductase
VANSSYLLSQPPFIVEHFAKHKMKAIRIKEAGKAEVVTDATIPELRDDYILVKTKAVALNPTDWKHIDYLASPGAIVGCDYSGIVERVGPKVRNGIQVGDRVTGMVHGSESRYRTFDRRMFC